jgi:hypothetical protein
MLAAFDLLAPCTLPDGKCADADEIDGADTRAAGVVPNASTGARGRFVVPVECVSNRAAEEGGSRTGATSVAGSGAGQSLVIAWKAA